MTCLSTADMVVMAIDFMMRVAVPMMITMVLVCAVYSAGYAAGQKAGNRGKEARSEVQANGRDQDD